MGSVVKGIIYGVLLLPIYLSSFLLNKADTGLPFDIYWYYPIMIAFVFLTLMVRNSFKIPRFYNGIILALFLGVALGSFTSISNSVKQLIIIVLNLVYYYQLLKIIGIDRSIQLYLNLSLVIGTLGFVQVILCVLDMCTIWEELFPFLTFHNLGTRLSSVESEPSYLAFSLLPAFAFIILNREIFTMRGLVIVLSYFLLNSLVAYVGILIVTLYVIFNANIRINRVKKIFGGMVLLLVAVLVGLRSEFILTRLLDLSRVLSADSWKFSGINQSTYSIATNSYVVFESIKESLFGPGLGNHIVNYLKYIPTGLNDDVNQEEAASLGLRFLSEYGVLFSVFFSLKIIKEINRSRDMIRNVVNNPKYIFAFTLWFVLLLRIIRQGHYTMNGLMFFITIYFLIFYEDKANH